MRRKPSTCWRRTLLWSASAACLAATGCTEPNPAYHPAPSLPDECRSGVEVSESFEDFERPDRLDVLLIVDDSGDVEDMQAAVAEALPGFLERLDEAGLDLRVGVATTDATGALGLAPAGTRADGCEENTTQIVTPSTQDWTEIAACNVQLGDEGDAFQQSLENADDLLAGADELFRERSRRLVVIVSNEDDCSSEATLSSAGVPARQVCMERADELTPVADLVASMQSATETASGLIFAVVGGPAAEADDSGRVRPVCSSSIGSAFPANRLSEAVTLFGDQGVFENLCAGTLGGPLGRIAEAVIEGSETTICPARALEHEPLQVDAVALDEDESSPIPLGEEGFVYLGPTDRCPNGAMRFAPTALRDVSAVEVTYCTQPE